MGALARDLFSWGVRASINERNREARLCGEGRVGEVLESDLPLALSLLNNLQEQVVAVTAQIQALTKKVQAGAYPTDKGLSFLEVKDQLLLMYLMDLSYLILDKASGSSLQEHPAILRLVEIRTVLEKLRPLDQKLKYQIDKLVRTAVTGSLSENDPLRFKPHPSNMISKLSSEDEDDEETEEGQSGTSGKKATKGAPRKYIPPRLVPVHYDETEAEREKKLLERAKKRALSSSVIRELKEQYSDAPEEIRDSRHPHATRQSQEDQHRIKYEESMMVRLSVSKREKGRRRRANAMSSQLHSLTHFSDISALTGGTPHLDEDQNPIKKRKKMLKKGRKKKGFRRRR
ncbi:neuroguidin isoform X1 [Monodelphis domestica]|uniref:neuroguidin isoform X1 n=1 Tax=Monodelphis domestica TaxID=13616 RepID=UPI0024E1EF87|nr:neuroguidin isoform X1 [Monodelphis domestica]